MFHDHAWDQAAQRGLLPEAHRQRDLAKLVQEDFSQKPRRLLTESQFKARVAYLLNACSQMKDGQDYSSVEKLVRGMPKRLAKCKNNLYGRCGK